MVNKSTPQWWRDAKLGIMITWGAYSVPAFARPGSTFFSFAEWYWFYQQIAPAELDRAIPGLSKGISEGEWPHRDYHLGKYGAGVHYDDLIQQWRAEQWDPDDWADLMAGSGARYFVLVAKHHDGVALWPSSTTSRHTGALGPRRDIVGELIRAATARDIRAGLFYAMAEWFNPAPRPAVIADPGEPLFDFAFNKVRRATDSTDGMPLDYTGYRDLEDYAAGHVVPQLFELIERYRPSILWADLPGDPVYYRSQEVLDRFYAMGAEHHRDGVVANDRVGLGVAGDFHTYEVGHVPPPDEGSAESFEACMSLSSSFGYNAMEPESGYLSSTAVIRALVDVVADGGNLLLNIGPRADGTIDPIQRARLADLGRWLAANGEAIYGTQPWLAAQGDLRFTRSRNGAAHADGGLDGAGYVISPPTGADELVISGIQPGAVVELVADGRQLDATVDGSTTRVQLPAIQHSRDVTAAPFVLRVREKSE